MRPGTDPSNMASRAEGTRSRPSPGSLDAKAVGKPQSTLRGQMPAVWKLLGPRRNLLIMGFFLMIINRISGLVLPVSSRFLFDNVFEKLQYGKLLPLIGIVLGATLIQAITSFALTQSLSVAAQRLIADLRK